MTASMPRYTYLHTTPLTPTIFVPTFPHRHPVEQSTNTPHNHQMSTPTPTTLTTLKIQKLITQPIMATKDVPKLKNETIP